MPRNCDNECLNITVSRIKRMAYNFLYIFLFLVSLGIVLENTDY